MEGIESAVGLTYQLEHHYMDTKKIPVSKFPKAAEAAWRKFKSFKPDLVMLGDDNALKLMGPRIAETGVAVVHYGVNNNPRVYFEGKIPENVYGVLERPLISPMVRHLESIIPDLKKILIMFDDSVSSRAVIESALYGKHSLSSPKGTIADIRVIDSWNKWKNRLLKAGNEYQAVLSAFKYTDIRLQ